MALLGAVEEVAVLLGAAAQVVRLLHKVERLGQVTLLRSQGKDLAVRQAFKLRPVVHLLLVGLVVAVNMQPVE